MSITHQRGDARELERKYMEVLETFRIQAETMLNHSIGNFNELIKKTVVDFNAMQEHYAKGNSEIIGQSQKANQELIDVAKHNYHRLKQNLAENFKHFRTVTDANFQNNVNHYNGNIKTILEKYPYLQPNVSDDMMNKLNAKFQQTTGEFEKKYNELVNGLDKTTGEFIESVTLNVSYKTVNKSDENPQGKTIVSIEYEENKEGKPIPNPNPSSTTTAAAAENRPFTFQTYPPAGPGSFNTKH